MSRTIWRRTALLASAAAAAALASTTAFAQAKHYRIAYDQPIGTGSWSARNRKTLPLATTPMC